MKALKWSLLGFLGLSVVGYCLLSPNVSAADGFSKVKCGGDIPAALIGVVLANERSSAVEARHKDLGLKDLGGDELSGGLSLSGWLICGSEYQLITDKRNVVRDVLKFPEHSKASPEFLGSCRINGKPLPGDVIAVLNNQPGAENLSAKFAWKIDTKTAKFVKLDTAGMQCPRDGINTADGGN